MTDEELKQEIEKVKKMISDYESLKTVIAPTSGEYERQMNHFALTGWAIY